MPTIESMLYSPISPEIQAIQEIDELLLEPPAMLARMAIIMHIDDENAQLAEAYENLDTAVNASRTPTVSYRRDGNVLYCNEWGIAASRIRREKHLQECKAVADIAEANIDALRFKKKRIENGDIKIIAEISSQQRLLLEARKRKLKGALQPSN